MDHNATDLEDLRENQTRYLQDLGDYVRGINQEQGKDVVFVVPVGQAALALREKIAAGKAPGLKMQWDLFRDPWGHAQPPLTVLSGYCHFAVIYRRSPVGLPMPTRPGEVSPHHLRRRIAQTRLAAFAGRSGEGRELE